MSIEAKRPTRKGRPNHPIDFKRRLAQRACEAGVSVSRLAQEHGVNANLLFKWRRHYRAGLFDQPDESAALLPVSIVPAPAIPSRAEPPAACPAVAPNAAIDIVFDGCTVRIGNSADMKILGTVLALLRR